MSTCNRLDLHTLGSQPVMPKNLPDQITDPFLTLLLTSRLPIRKKIYTPINEMAAPSMYLVGVKSNFLPTHAEAWAGSKFYITSTTKWALNQIS